MKHITNYIILCEEIILEANGSLENVQPPKNDIFHYNSVFDINFYQ